MTNQLAEHVTYAEPEHHRAFARTEFDFPNGDIGHIVTFFTRGENQTRVFHTDDLNVALRRKLGIWAR